MEKLSPEGTFYDSEDRVKCKSCLWVIEKCKCKEDKMSFVDKQTIGSMTKVYYDKWLSVATNGNVKFEKVFSPVTMQDRIGLHCQVCSSSLILNGPDAVNEGSIVPYEAQEFAKLHVHKSPVVDPMPGPKAVVNHTFVYNTSIAETPVLKPGQVVEVNGVTYTIGLTKVDNPEEISWPTPPKGIVWDSKEKVLKLEKEKPLKLEIKSGRRFR